MRFADITGQDSLKERLAVMADSGRVSHAYLFTGGEGYGALPLAIAFARYLNCANPSGGDSCGVCRSCLQMESFTQPDLHFSFPVNKSARSKITTGDAEKPVSDHLIGAWREMLLSSSPRGYFSEQEWYRSIEIENKQGNISRHEAAEIIRKLSFKAFESKYKIVLMWLPERMNTQAANTLLKILEEPWDNTIFLLVSESPELLLQTVLSRTQEVHLPAIGSGELTRWIMDNSGSDAEKAEKIAGLSCGNLLEARRLAEDNGGESEYLDMFINLMRLSFNDKHLELLEWAESASSLGRENQKLMLENVLRLLRDSYMLSIGADKVSFLYGSELQFCTKFAPYVNNNNIEKLLIETESVIRHISQNGNPKIIFTHYVLTVSKLIARI